MTKPPFRLPPDVEALFRPGVIIGMPPSLLDLIKNRPNKYQAWRRGLIPFVPHRPAPPQATAPSPPRRPNRAAAMRLLTGPPIQPAAPILMISGDVNNAMVKRVERFVRDYAAAPALSIIINSPGGTVAAAHRVYNLLRKHPWHISARVTGVCASAAVMILAAADHREAVPEAYFLLHSIAINPPEDGEKRWTSAAHKKAGELLERDDADLIRHLAGRTGKPRATFAELMRKAKPLTAAKAAEIGLVHHVLDPQRPGRLMEGLSS